LDFSSPLRSSFGLQTGVKPEAFSETPAGKSSVISTSIGLIAGIIVGAVVLTAVIIGLIIFLRHRKSLQAEAAENAEEQEAVVGFTQEYYGHDFSNPLDNGDSGLFPGLMENEEWDVESSSDSRTVRK
jgi:hypothetical protein